MNLDEIYKNNRNHVAKVLKLHIDKLELEKLAMTEKIDKVAMQDEIDLFNNAVKLIIESDLK